MSLDPNWGRQLAPNPGVHTRPPRAGGELRPPFTHQELVEIGKELFEQFIKRVVLAIVNQVPLGGQAFQMLSEWADTLDGRIGSFLDAFDGIDLNGSPGAILRAITGAFLDGVGQFLSLIPLGRITTARPNTLTAGDFTATDSIAANSDWAHDPAVGRTAAGSAKVTADGSFKALRSNAVPVEEGQQLPVSVWLSWDGVSATGTAFRLDLVSMLDGSQVAITTLDSISTPAADSGWVELSDTFDVPAGVDEVVVRLVVTETVTAGDVWWDDGAQQQLGVVERAVFGLLDLLGLSQIPDLISLNPAAVWTSIITGQLNPLELIEDAVGRTIQQGIIDRIFGAFNNFGQIGDTGNPIDAVLSSAWGIFDTGLKANARLAQQDARITALESSANSIVLDFAGAAATSLGSDWDVSSSGPGAGSMGLDGMGNLVWRSAGAASRIQVGRYQASALTTNNCRIQAYLSSSPQNPLFDNAYTYLNFRMNTAKTTYTRLRLGYGSVLMQAVVSGVVTNISSNVAVYPIAGGLLEVIAGEPADANNLHFIVKLQGEELLDFTDGGTAQYGPTLLHVGVGMETGNRLVFFQNIPAGLAVMTATEVL